MLPILFQRLPVGLPHLALEALLCGLLLLHGSIEQLLCIVLAHLFLGLGLLLLLVLLFVLLVFFILLILVLLVLILIPVLVLLVLVGIVFQLPLT